MMIANGCDDADEAPQAGWCHRATTWGNTGGGALRPGGCLMYVRAGVVQLALRIAALFQNGSERLCLRICALYFLRLVSIRLCNGSMVS